MRDTEEVVRRVLEGLRDVEAPTGMESRILLALERRASEPRRTRWRRAWCLPPLSSIGMRSLAGGVAFAGLACAVLWMPKPRRSATMPVASRLVETPTSASNISAPTLPARRADVRLQIMREVQVNAVLSSDALALAEMRAPSQPAPPMPLTEQERLLLRVARRHDPEQIAMLNPEMRSRQELQAKVEFQEFFEPVRSVEEKSHTDSTYKKGDTQ